MKKGLAKVVSLLVLGGVLLSGCGTNTTASTTTAGASDSSGESTGAATQATAAAGDTVTLNVFNPQPRFEEQYAAYLDQFCVYYEEQTGVKVEYNLEMPTADTAAQILKTRLTTGDAPDVFTVHAINEKQDYFNAGYLEDLSGEAWVDTLFESAQAAVTENGGKVVCLPLESLTWGYLYNKDIYTELGLKVPMTLDEMNSNIAAIEAAGYTPFLSTYAESWIPQLFLPLTVGAFVKTTNTDFVTKMSGDTGSFSEISGMFDIIDLVNAHTNEDALDFGNDNGCVEFATGNYAMWVQGPWDSESILTADPEFNLGVAPLPVSNDASQTVINNSVSTSWAVSSTSEHKDVAKAMIAYFLNADTSNEFFQSVQFNPLSSVHTFEPYPWIAEATTYVEAGKSVVDPSIPQAVKDESGIILQAYWQGTATKEQVMSDLDTTWKTYNATSK